MIEVVRGDITKLGVECIVNASNRSGLGCNIPNHCVDSAIHFAAGYKLLEECKTLNGIPTGVAKTTRGYNLPSKYVIHVTGPQHVKGQPYEWDVLAKSYIAVLDQARMHGIKELAFCCVSTGLFGYPKQESAHIAFQTVLNNMQGIERVLFCCYTYEDYDIYNKLHSQY